MKEPKYTLSVSVPKSYYDLLHKLKEKEQVKFVYQVFLKALDLLIEKHNFKRNGNDVDLEFIDAAELATQREKDSIETQLCSILSRDYFALQEEFIQGDYIERGYTIFDFCDERGLDWKKLLRDDSTYKRKNNIIL